MVPLLPKLQHFHRISCSPSPYQSNKSRCSNRQHTPFLYNQDSIKVIAAPSFTDNVKGSAYPKEGSLLTEWASDGQVSFYTHLMQPTQNGTRSMTVKINPGAQVNTTPEQVLEALPHKISESRYPKPGTLIPTSHSWISHDSKPHPFLGHFIPEVNHATLPRPYPTNFYVIEDATSSQILLLYATSEHLEILEFKVPNLASQSHIDALTVPTSPNPGGSRKIAKSATFQDPLIDPAQPHCTSPHGHLRKTMKMKTIQLKDPITSIINSTYHKGPSLPCTSLLLSVLKVSKPALPATKPKSSLKPPQTQSDYTPPSTAVPQDIFVLKWASLAPLIP